jgi:acetyl esterase/lipase
MASHDILPEISTRQSNLSSAAARGNEITGLSIYQDTNEEITLERVKELMSEMNADVPQGGVDIVFGDKETQRLRFWEPTSKSRKAPIIVFVHGGSWTIGTYLDSVGSLKVKYLNNLGYAFASVDFALIPSVTVEEQVQEVADAVSYIMRNSKELGIDPESVVLMGHSSGAHVVSLVGTDTSYAQKAPTTMQLRQLLTTRDQLLPICSTHWVVTHRGWSQCHQRYTQPDPTLARFFFSMFNAREIFDKQ